VLDADEEEALYENMVSMFADNALERLLLKLGLKNLAEVTK
jgi:hypothetical protein